MIQLTQSHTIPVPQLRRNVLHFAVRHPVKPLVRRSGIQASQMCDIRSQLDIIETARVDTCGQFRTPRIPACLQPAPGRSPHTGAPMRDIAGRCIASHKTNAGNRISVSRQQTIQQIIVQRLPDLFPQMGTVTPGAPVRAPRKIQSEGHFARNLLEHHIKTGQA